MTAPSIKEALADLIVLAERNIYPQPDKPGSDWARVEAAKSALTTLSQPTADRREIVARECADELVLIVEAAERVAKRTGNTFVIDRQRVAQMIAGRLAALDEGPMRRLSGAKCHYCHDTGWVAIRSRDGAYAFPGAVPDDAKGYADADCWYCDCAPSPTNGGNNAKR